MAVIVAMAALNDIKIQLGIIFETRFHTFLHFILKIMYYTNFNNLIFYIVSFEDFKYLLKKKIFFIFLQKYRQNYNGFILYLYLIALKGF